MKNLLKIIVPTAISVIGSVFLYKLLFSFMIALLAEQLKQLPGLTTNLPLNAFDYSLYFFCLTYLFALIALPFILSVLSEKPIVKKGNAGIKLLVAEALVLILVWVFSPPGLINKIIYFVLWQVPVVVNFMTLLLVRARRSRRTGKRSIHENP